jgi:hypothetical protein
VALERYYRALYHEVARGEHDRSYRMRAGAVGMRKVMSVASAALSDLVRWRRLCCSPAPEPGARSRMGRRARCGCHQPHTGVAVGIPVFLSRTQPHTTPQKRFLEALCEYLRSRGLEPRTVGDTDFGLNGLEAVRGLLRQSNGLICVAFKRSVVREGADRPDADRALGEDLREVPLRDTWLTTPWCHMESAMAYQIGLPVLLLVQRGVRQDGALENGVLGQYPPLFDLEADARDLQSVLAGNLEKWRQLAGTWEGHVREVVHSRAQPPSLYGVDR